MVHSASYNTCTILGSYAGKNGYSKHHFICIFVYECGCQGYLYVFLLRTALRSAQILIFKKKGSRAMILSRFSERQRSASRSQFWLHSSASKSGHSKHQIFTFGTYFHLWQDICWRTSTSWHPIQFTCEGYLYIFLLRRAVRTGPDFDFQVNQARPGRGRGDRRGDGRLGPGQGHVCRPQAERERRFLVQV